MDTRDLSADACIRAMRESPDHGRALYNRALAEKRWAYSNVAPLMRQATQAIVDQLAVYDDGDVKTGVALWAMKADPAGMHNVFMQVMEYEALAWGVHLLGAAVGEMDDCLDKPAYNQDLRRVLDARRAWLEERAVQVVGYWYRDDPYCVKCWENLLEDPGAEGGLDEMEPDPILREDLEDIDDETRCVADRACLDGEADDNGTVGKLLGGD